jgi:hypothetical protein
MGFINSKVFKSPDPLDELLFSFARKGRDSGEDKGKGDGAMACLYIFGRSKKKHKV